VKTLLDQISSSIIRYNREWTYAYAVLCALFLTLIISPGISITDESVYLLMLDSFVSDGSLSIWNGLEYTSIEYEVTDSVDIHENKLIPQYPKIYLIILAPFYILFGIKGMILVNLISFAGTLIILYHTANIVFENEKPGLLSVIIYSFFTYSTRFAVDLWPHSLAVFFVSLSVYLAIRWFKKSGIVNLFFSGFFSGLVIGIRYPTFLYSMVILALLIVKMREHGLHTPLIFLTGLAIPIITLLTLNQILYGSFYILGYSGIDDDFGGFKYFGLFFISFTMIVLSHLSSNKSMDIIRTRTSLFIILALVFTMILIDPDFLSHTMTSVSVMYSEVVDISMFPIETVTIPENKKSLLQAAPILALALPGLFLIRRREGNSVFHMIALLSLIEILFYSSRVNQHGGETPLMRYFLQSLPYLTLSTAYCISSMKLKINIKSGVIMSVIAFFLIFTPFMNIGDETLLFNKLYQLKYPLLISGLLILSAAMIIHDLVRTKTLFIIALILALSYSFVLNNYQIINSSIVRDKTIDISRELDFIEDDSVVIFYGSMHMIYLGLVKTDKNMRLVNAAVDDTKTTKGLADYYLRNNIPVYIVYRVSEKEENIDDELNNGYWRSYVDATFLKSYNSKKIDTKTLRLIRLISER